MNQTWQLRAFAGYLLLGPALAASCAREVNTLEEEETSGSGGSAPGSAGAVASKASGGKAGSASSAFGGTSSKGGGGGKPGTAGSSIGDGGDGATGGSAAGKASGTGGKGGAGDSASGGSGGSVPPDVLARASVVVYYQTSHAMPLDGTIQMKLFIENRSADPLPMANVEIRYWFTAEVATELHQYYTGPEVKQPQAAFVGDAESSYASMTFGGGSVAKGSDLNASEVQLEISSNAGKFEQSDDFSWLPGASASTPNDKITLYLDHVLLWGCEPSGACADAGAGGASGVGQAR